MTELALGIERGFIQPAAPVNDPMIYQVEGWPKSMQESTCQAICRIAYEILSWVVFPIILVRLVGWGLCKMISWGVLPAAYLPEKAVDSSSFNNVFQDVPSVLSAFSLSVSSCRPLINHLDGQEALKDFINDLHDALANTSPDLAGAQDLTNRLIVLLNRLPDDILSKLFLGEVDRTLLGNHPWHCGRMLVEVFTQIATVLSCLSSRESQEIFRRVILQQPNVIPVTMTTPDNVQLDGVYLKNNDDADATTLVLCNPNAVAYEEYFKELDQGYRDSQGRPFNYLFFNYRGVGRSEGSPTPDGLLIDSYTAVKFLQEAFDVPRKKIITHGWSIGGPMAVFAAFENQGEAADGSDSISCCNDRSMSSLPKEIEYFVSTGYNNCCIPAIAATMAKWSGWNWDVMEWWRGLNGYKWAVVNRGDQVVPYDVSLPKAWREESPDEAAGKILEMFASLDGHMRPFHLAEREIQRRHMACASLIN